MSLMLPRKGRPRGDGMGTVPSALASDMVADVVVRIRAVAEALGYSRDVMVGVEQFVGEELETWRWQGKTGAGRVFLWILRRSGFYIGGETDTDIRGSDPVEDTWRALLIR